MKPELQEKLRSSFPILYGTPIGFDVPDGWFPHLYKLSAKLESLNHQIPSSLTPIYCNQCKEKFGGLRFYLGPVSTDFWDRVYRLVEKAEKDSYRWCTKCGATTYKGDFCITCL